VSGRIEVVLTLKPEESPKSGAQVNVLCPLVKYITLRSLRVETEAENLAAVMSVVTKAPGRTRSASAASPACWLIVSLRVSPGTGGVEVSWPRGVGSLSALTW
jgi:hypothetical protein